MDAEQKFLKPGDRIELSPYGIATVLMNEGASGVLVCKHAPTKEHYYSPDDEPYFWVCNGCIASRGLEVHANYLIGLIGLGTCAYCRERFTRNDLVWYNRRWPPVPPSMAEIAEN